MSFKASDAIGARILKLTSILAFCAVAWLSLAPRPLPNRELQNLLHPFEHVAMFAAFSLVCFWVWPGKGRIVFASVMAIAVVMELIQGLVPVRAFQLDDLAMNLCGVIIGAALAFMIQRGLSLVQTKS